MKKLIFTVFTIMFFFNLSFTQSDTTYLAQVNDSTYQKVFISYDDQGREIASERIYYDSLTFFNFIFDLVVKSDKSFTRSENKLIAAQKAEKKGKKEFKEMKDFYLSFTSNSYVSVLDSVLKSQLNGDWRLVVNDTIYNTTLTNNGNKLKDIDSDKKMKITYFQVGKLELKVVADMPFFNEDINLLEEKDNQGRRMYRAKLADGTKVILKR
jgi:hypothetical protein